MKRLLLALLMCAPAGAATAGRPNLLFILTDDQGWPTLSCYGNKLVATPHLDRLAAEGARFTDAYVMPQCTPTRAALLTGQHTARNGLWHVIPWYGAPWAPVREPPFTEQLSRDAFTFPKALRAAGYATGMAGKWHLTTSADGNYVSLKPEAAAHYGFDFSAPPGPGSQNEGDKHVDYLTAQAIEFIRRERSRPWFFYLAHHTIHNTVAAPAPLVEKYRARGAPATGLHNATYLAAIEHLDHSVGRLLAALDELGQRERTFVVFLSDNGGIYQGLDVKPFTQGPGTATQLSVEQAQFSNAPLRAGKGSAYEGGIRVPCLVRWPGVVAPGRTVATPVHVVDWAPTLLAAAGAAAPREAHLDGVDLGPLLRGGSLPSRALFWHLPLYDLRWAATPCAVIREGDWKLIDYFGDSFDAANRYRPGARLELFHLRSDLAETTDLAEREPDRARTLQATLRHWLQSVGAEFPGPNPHHDPTQPLREVREKPPHLRPAAVAR
ncbi:MAG: sulfatase [Verrucomicrobia bacterium]|nr:sulfatase [Verrucomicrobiota bacterium]